MRATKLWTFRGASFYSGNSWLCVSLSMNTQPSVDVFIWCTKYIHLYEEICFWELVIENLFYSSHAVDWWNNLLLMVPNWPDSQIPECTSSISHNAPFRTEMCTFLFWMEHCGIGNRCIMGFVKLLYCYEVIAMVGTSGRYGCAVVMSWTEINKAVPQWLLTFNLCISVTWP